MYKKVVLYFILFLTGIRALEAVTRFFVHTSSKNSGIAFALPVHAIFLYLLIFLAVSCLAVALRHLHSHYYVTPIILMLAGGSSNVIDRILYGAVIDQITILNWQGNVADITLFIGIIWIAWGMMKGRNDTSSHASTH